MDLETAKKIITSSPKNWNRYVKKAKRAQRYYKGKNDILYPKRVPKPWLDKKGVRKADNRIASNFFGTLLNQKASYVLGKTPVFDTGNDSYNDTITQLLGGHFNKTCKHLVIDAGCCSCGWIHSWLDEDGSFHYGTVDPKQVRATWGSTLENKLMLVERRYSVLDEDGESYDIYEIWDDTYCYAYRKKANLTENFLEEFSMFTDITGEPTNIYEHGFSEIPFSCFWNNSVHTNDLDAIKGWIDAYDKTMSLFVDNIEDVQNVIFVFRNMGGSSVREMIDSIRETGGIKVIQNDVMQTGLDTITLEVPVDAATTLLDLADKNIYKLGGGVKDDPENYGNASGVALKFMYAGLEQKCILLEDEFRIGFDHFIKRLLESQHITLNDTLEQTWTRTRISNDTDTINNIKNSVGIISNDTLLQHHPFVDNPAEEERLLEEQRSRDDVYVG